jgi:hypothetical protein
MSDFLPKAGGIKIGGQSRKAQKLQALRDKAANAQTPGAKPNSTLHDLAAKSRTSFTGKKTAFQRKAT